VAISALNNALFLFQRLFVACLSTFSRRGGRKLRSQNQKFKNVKEAIDLIKVNLVGED
jgi:hypothetical protein